MINLWHSLSYDNGFNIWHTSTILSVATNPLKIKNENLFKKKIKKFGVHFFFFPVLTAS